MDLVWIDMASGTWGSSPILIADIDWFTENGEPVDPASLAAYFDSLSDDERIDAFKRAIGGS